ncbi:diguanylate cyclase domain-containing protein [Alteromonas oceanisediminis]|uniref:diguanylate cyclase domain-containing protein n=1 Tax=Alteromonas oceanisediminis TaxID=2836180 RepID=UPI001BD94B7F|nr:diguanylate cyclase [Alteromonas oceanisediminis]MBT0588157.1 diguanylate cyclase [Alteromonas oceanisediminis]
MIKFSQQLYIRVAVTIAVVAAAISLAAAGLTYYQSLQQQRSLNGELVNQLAGSVTKTAAIAAYLDDDDLAQEIVNGLADIDIVGGAQVIFNEDIQVQKGNITGRNSIRIPLIDPFSGEEQVGTLVIVPNQAFIQAQAQSIGTQSVIVLILLSVIISAAVSQIVHRNLTRPLRQLTQGFSKVDPSIIDSMQPIDIDYKKRDEIGTLVSGINALIIALKQNLQTERILRERTQKLEQKFRVIFEQASAGIGLVNSDNQLMTLNKAMLSLFEGVQEGDDITQLFVDSGRVTTTLNQMRNLQPFGQISLDLEFMHGDEKRWVHCLFAKVTEQRLKRRLDQGMLIEVIMYDITERIRREQSVRFEADHDSLTKLRNRRSGERALIQSLEQCLRNTHTFVLMMIDLDDFKPVNDTYGHDVGDEVLVTISERMMRYFNAEDDVCVRWGGDEFVVGFSLEQSTHNSLDTLCQQLLAELRTPIHISETIECQVGGSIGVAQAPENGNTIDELISLADTTMYTVKQQGRGNYIIAKT